MLKAAPKLSKIDRTKILMTRLKEISRKEVLVGITQESSSRPGEDINSAELLYVHTHGSPARGIPARPVIEPAIRADGNRELITGLMAEGAKSLFDAQPAHAERMLNLAGQAGEDAARGWFTDPRNGWPPNAPATVQRKLDKMRGKQGKAAQEAFEAGADSYEFQGQTFGLNTPLVDTGEMRKAITHVVRDRQ